MYKTLIAAYVDGWQRPRPQEYDGERLALKGHILIRNPKCAISKTEWSKMGFRLKEGEQPHAIIKGRIKGGMKEWAVYREDQVEPKKIVPGRTEAARKAVATKRAKMASYLDDIKVEIPCLSIPELIKLACDSYNAAHALHGSYASETSDSAFLNRICVNYLRHELSHYEELLSNIKGKVGSKEAYLAIKEKVLDAIEEQYPELTAECRKQLKDAEARVSALEMEGW